jgi:hypothetical protein
MEYNMLLYKRWKPDSTNPSNYWQWISRQWCWFDYNPSCFYDHNDDWIIDSYN